MKVAALGIIAALYSIPAFADGLPHWQVLGDKSSVQWTAQYGGKPITGTFPAFSAEIDFDPAHLDASKATVKIETGKVKTSDKDALQDLPTDDWFASSKFPLATFQATTFKHVKDDDYQAEGTLTVRDKSIKVTLPFTAKFHDESATAPPVHYALIQGSTLVKRTQLGVGQGDWAATDTIADDVKLDIHIEAKQVQ